MKNRIALLLVEFILVYGYSRSRPCTVENRGSHGIPHPRLSDLDLFRFMGCSFVVKHCGTSYWVYPRVSIYTSSDSNSEYPGRLKSIIGEVSSEQLSTLPVQFLHDDDHRHPYPKHHQRKRLVIDFGTISRIWRGHVTKPCPILPYSPLSGSLFRSCMVVIRVAVSTSLVQNGPDGDAPTNCLFSLSKYSSPETFLGVEATEAVSIISRCCTVHHQ